MTLTLSYGKRLVWVVEVEGEDNDSSYSLFASKEGAQEWAKEVMLEELGEWAYSHPEEELPDLDKSSSYEDVLDAYNACCGDDVAVYSAVLGK